LSSAASEVLGRHGHLPPGLDTLGSAFRDANSIPAQASHMLSHASPHPPLSLASSGLPETGSSCRSYTGRLRVK
jgi:hypothetical protein